MKKEDMQPLLEVEEDREELKSNSNEKSKEKSNGQIIPASCFIKYICCCCNKYDVTAQEYKIYTKLLKESSELYDENNPSHENSLNQFYEKAATIYLKVHPECEKNEGLWRVFGFQGDDPRRDFRAGGIFSLKFMNYILVNNEKFALLCFEKPFFSFALVCIKILFLTRIMLRLISGGKIEVLAETNKVNLCSRKQIKHFVKALKEDDIIYFELLYLMTVFIYEQYNKDYIEGKKELNVLLIGPIIKTVLFCFEEALKNGEKKEEIIDNLKREFRITKVVTQR